MNIASILEPSKGGIGIRFRAHNTTFILRVRAINSVIAECAMKVSGIARIMAKRKFDRGPARATRAPSRFGFLKY